MRVIDKEKTEEMGQTDPPALTPEQVAPQPTDSGRERRFWLRYTGPAGTSVDDPNTGRTWRPGEEQEVTEEEGNRLVASYPNETALRSTYRDEPTSG